MTYNVFWWDVKPCLINPSSPLPSLPLLPHSFPFHFPLSIPFPSIPPFRSRPLNAARGYGERYNLPQRGLGRSLSRNRIRCILALKFDIW